jgi:hypothetical protein
MEGCGKPPVGSAASKPHLGRVGSVTRARQLFDDRFATIAPPLVCLYYAITREARCHPVPLTARLLLHD